jgi:flagellar biosynthesis component FlhA
VRESEAQGRSPVMLVATRLRPAVRRMLRPSLPRVGVIGAGEVGSNVKVAIVGSVNREISAVA